MHAVNERTCGPHGELLLYVGAAGGAAAAAERHAGLLGPLHSIRRVDASTLSAVQFHREFVSRNVPVVLLNSMTSPQWQRAMANWQSDDHLVARRAATR